MGRSVATRLVEMARAEFDAVVVDAGPPAPDRIGFEAGHWILVVEPTPAGIVRAGRLVSGWTWATPIVVANMVPNGPDHDAAIKLIRAATGLEPAVAIPPLDMDTTVAHPAMVSLLAPLARSMFGSAQRSAAR